MTTGATIKATLATVTGESIHNGTMTSLWSALPDHVAGPQWAGEIWGSAITLADWLDDEREYSLDDLQELTYQLADSECEDYYSNINRRVQELSLWASTYLDDKVSEFTTATTMLTDLNQAYLYWAMQELYSVLAQWAMDSAEELESVA